VLSFRCEQSPGVDPVLLAGGEAVMARNVLIIEDDLVFQSVLVEAFSAAGFEVRGAANGRVAMKMFLCEPADLVITDILMPEKDGIEVITDLRQELFPPKVIAMSGGGRMCGLDVLRLADLLGADVTMVKPLNVGRLINRARELLAALAAERAELIRMSSVTPARRAA
jgi:DNA-binding response OmpR family regulator